MCVTRFRATARPSLPHSKGKAKAKAKGPRNEKKKKRPKKEENPSPRPTGPPARPRRVNCPSVCWAARTAMDEARLLDSLRQKLDELECEVEACRRHLLPEFHQHCRLLLRDVTPEAASDVKRALAASFANYPALRPELEADSPPPRPLSRCPPPPPPSPPPISAAFQSAVCGRTEAPARARHRDLELHGLFTPSFLPLLDDSPVSPRPALGRATGTVPADPSLLPERGAGLAGMDQTSHHAGAHAHGSPRRLLPAVQPLSVPDPPTDTARSTDDTRSSVSSDKSDSKPPRSALRRSSSMSKAPQSPRRVRFEFMGAEVLPTTSPQPSESLRRRPSSPGPDDGAFASDLAGDTAEDERVPPRKVSSSDALRALSRTPREEGVAWTVVNADADQFAPDQRDSFDATPPPAAPSPPKTTHSPLLTKTLSPKRSSGETPTKDGHDGKGDSSSSSSDDGFLAMAKARSSSKKPSQATAHAPKAPIKPQQGGATTSASPTNRQSPRFRCAKSEHSRALHHDEDTGVDEADDDDDVFHFDGEQGAPIKSRSRPSPPPAPREEDVAEHSEADDADESHVLQAQTSESQMSTYATSPAVPIRQPWGSRPVTASGVKSRPGSLGSYKGQPILMPIVRNPELLAQAGSVGSSDKRMGDVDDQTAMEDGSPPRFPSTPFSFKERFIMEEMMERAKPNKDDRAG